MKTFWMVVRLDATTESHAALPKMKNWQGQPAYQHPNEMSARAEAARLAREHYATFAVLKTIATVGPAHPPITWDNGKVEPEPHLPATFSEK